MKKVMAVLAATVTMVFVAACDEQYEPVSGSEPPQVVVHDQGDKIDQSNIEAACRAQGREVTDVKFVGNGKEKALVTCTKESK